MIESLLRNVHTFAVTSCSSSHGFFGFPSWDSYLEHRFNTKLKPPVCEIYNFHVPQDFLLVALALLDDALHLAGLVAIGFVIYGGIQYVTSQGEPTETVKARSTIINSLVGLVITLLAVGVVKFLGARLGG